MCTFNADRDNIGTRHREKLDSAIKHKCIYGLWNDRGSMAFKLTCASDLEALKNIEPIYKEECHVHQFIIPSKTAVLNQDDQTPQQNNNSGSEQNT